MRSLSIVAAALSLVPWAAGQQQRLLSDHSGATAAPIGSSVAPSYRHDLLHLHKDLISTPSTSGDENAVGQFLVNYLTGRGYNADLQPVAPSDDKPDARQRFNVLAWKGDKSAINPRVIVTSHIDAVPPHIPYGVEEGAITKDTVIKGRGSCDAKGSVAAMIVAVDNLLAADKISGDDVMLLFVVGEETTGDGMKTFSASVANMHPSPRFESVIFGEPTENKLACGHKGGLFCDVFATGKAAHSGYPELGKSANEIMMRAMVKILDADLGSSDVYGNTTVNVGRFDGGVAGNVVPAHAFVKLVARVAIGPQESGHLIVKEKMAAILNEVDEDAFEFKCSSGGYGFVQCNCDVDGFDTLTAKYGTDIPHLAGDYTKYLYGPGSILVAHGDDENVTIGALEESVEGFQKLILHALKQ